MKNFNPDDHMKKESPLIYHVYNDTKVKSFQNYLPFFYKIYNVSAMKMHQMATRIGGTVRGVSSIYWWAYAGENIFSSPPSKSFLRCMSTNGCGR